MARISIVALAIFLFFSVVYLGANLFFRLGDEAARKTDLDFIAKHCLAVPNASGSKIAENLVIDQSFSGTVYIYDGDPIFDKTSAFEVAWRGRLSELLCAPVIGCLLAPRLAQQCKSGVE